MISRNVSLAKSRTLNLRRVAVQEIMNEIP